jgi:hypothetical protein
MQCFVLDVGHGCYKRGYDALKLAKAALLWAGVAPIASVAQIAGSACNALSNALAKLMAITQ